MVEWFDLALSSSLREGDATSPCPTIRTIVPEPQLIRHLTFWIVLLTPLGFPR